jgi:hypothetical protein
LNSGDLRPQSDFSTKRHFQQTNLKPRAKSSLPAGFLTVGVTPLGREAQTIGRVKKLRQSMVDAAKKSFNTRTSKSVISSEEILLKVRYDINHLSR